MLFNQYKAKIARMIVGDNAHGTRDFMFSISADRYVPLVTKLIDELRAKGLTVATAESCTGGLLASLLTALPGSSDVYRGGVSAYSNRAKTDLLGVSDDVLKTHGAVSREAASAMAEGARKVLGADCAISVTGIAGPGGAVPGKPVGTIWCGFAGPWGTRAELFPLQGDRTHNRAEISRLAIERLIDYIRSLEGKGPS